MATTHGGGGETRLPVGASLVAHARHADQCRSRASQSRPDLASTPSVIVRTHTAGKPLAASRDSSL
eukprot:7391479-Prymnesium_polylepis.1